MPTVSVQPDPRPLCPLQAEDRAHRIGQKREVLVLIMVSSGTIEEVGRAWGRQGGVGAGGGGRACGAA